MVMAIQAECTLSVHNSNKVKNTLWLIKDIFMNTKENNNIIRKCYCRKKSFKAKRESFEIKEFFY